MLRGAAGVRQPGRRHRRELIVADAARELRPRLREACGIEPGRRRVARARDVRTAFEAAERTGRDAVVVGDDDVGRRRRDGHLSRVLREARRRDHDHRGGHPEALVHCWRRKADGVPAPHLRQLRGNRIPGTAALRNAGANPLRIADSDWFNARESSATRRWRPPAGVTDSGSRRRSV